MIVAGVLRLAGIGLRRCGLQNPRHTTSVRADNRVRFMVGLSVSIRREVGAKRQQISL